MFQNYKILILVWISNELIVSCIFFSIPALQFAAQAKRPEVVKETKKKPPKRKRKKDPNEPQKPVSAYALFFRDTQAAIKGQNPNASFGEVSKIVASMWDSLEPDQKAVSQWWIILLVQN